MNSMDPSDITAHFQKLDQLLIPVDLEFWDTEVDPVHAPYGYMPMELTCMGGANWQRMFRFCPELIASQLDGHDESVAQRYLDSIVIHLKIHLSHIEDGGEEFEARIEEALELLDPLAYTQIQAVKAGVDVVWPPPAREHR